MWCAEGKGLRTARLNDFARPPRDGMRGTAREGQGSVSGLAGYGCGFLAPCAAAALLQGGAGGGAAKRGARGTIAATGSRRPWPCAASVERPGHDAPATEAPPARRPLIAVQEPHSFESIYWARPN